MKKILIKIAAVLAVICLLFGMIAPAISAAPLYVTPPKFKEPTPTKEYFKKVLQTDVTKVNQVLPQDSVYTIEKGISVTVVKGATLTIYGTLNIEGTLINKGTIVLADREADEPGENHHYGLLQNGNKLTNKGVIEIKQGNLINKSKAEFVNDGAVNIRISADSLIGINNLRTKVGDKVTYGTITNNGTITVANTAGTGLRNASDAVFTNNGAVEKTEDGTIKGKITGNKVVAKEQ